MTFDLLIRGGLVVTAQGEEPADVGVTGGRVVADGCAPVQRFHTLDGGVEQEGRRAAGQGCAHLRSVHTD